MKTIKDLRQSVPQIGRLDWIGTATKRMAELTVRNTAVLEPGTGLDNEHHSTSGKGKRQVTLIQAEYLAVIAALLRRDTVRPEELRRNLVVSGINLNSLKGARFAIGETELEGSGYCHPCSRMEDNLGDGGYSAMTGHGGITAIVVNGGRISVGDPVRFLPDTS